MNIALKTHSGLVTSRPDTTWERENRDLYIPDFVTGMLWSPVLFTRIGKAGKCVGRKYADRYTDGMGFGLLLHPLVECGGQSVPLSCMDHTTILPFPLYNKVVLDTPGNEAVYLLNGNDVMCSFRTGAEIPEGAGAETPEKTGTVTPEKTGSGAVPAELNAGTALAETALAGTALAGTALAGTALAGTALAGTALAGTALAETALAGTIPAELILDAICEVSRFTSLRIGDIVATELLSPAPLPLNSSRTTISATFCDNGIFDFSILR